MYYSVLVTENHQKYLSRYIVHELSFINIFKRNLIMVTKQLFWKKILCGCFRSSWLWLLLAIMKRCAERCALQLFHTSLNDNLLEIIFLLSHLLFSHILRNLIIHSIFFVSYFQESLPYFWLTIFRHNM